MNTKKAIVIFNVYFRSVARAAWAGLELQWIFAQIEIDSVIVMCFGSAMPFASGAFVTHVISFIMP